MMEVVGLLLWLFAGPVLFIAWIVRVAVRFTRRIANV